MRLRAPEPRDAEEVFAVMAARDLADLGVADCTLEDVLAVWANPDIDLARDCAVVETPDGEIVGTALVDARCAVVYVHPDHEGRGIGTMLREFSEGRARGGSRWLRSSPPPTRARPPT